MKYIKIKNMKLKIDKSKDSTVITNTSKRSGLILLDINFGVKSKNCEVKFFGEMINGALPSIKIIGANRKVFLKQELNTSTIKEFKHNSYLTILYVPPESKFKIDNLEINFINKINYLDYFEEYLKGDVLVVTPLYPNENNKYLAGFVHTRIKSYIQNDLKVSIICSNKKINNIYHSKFENVDVMNMDYSSLAQIVESNRFKKIIIHFMSLEFSKIMDLCDYTQTQITLICHGPEVIYRDMNITAVPYLNGKSDVLKDIEDYYLKMDRMIKKYNEIPNVKFVFVANIQKERSENHIGLKYINSVMIPNYVNTDIFNFVAKDKNKRKNILVLRKFEDVNSYSLDIVAKTIFELSKRDFFSDLNISIYGDGPMHANLTNMISNFSNVKIFKKFLTHNEIGKVHKENGIMLIPSRYDSGAVSMCEAASSGLVIVGSDIPSYREWLGDIETLANQEDYVEMANIIEKIYKEELDFQSISANISKGIQDKCKFENTLLKEIELLNLPLNDRSKINFENIFKNPILTVCVPAYNSENWLNRNIFSLTNHEDAGKIEIIIVNDGSKDNTIEVAKQWERKLSNNIRPIIKVIDKENGGHGSTINKGIEVGTGKYFKIVDSDDWVNTKEFYKLVSLLEEEEVDLVLTNLSVYELSKNSNFLMDCYRHLDSGVEYNINDLFDSYYGFREWGPLMGTSNYKLENLKKGNFKISENLPFVDMEYNCFSIKVTQNLKYYDLDVYRYYIGREEQTVSVTSIKNNYKKQRKIINNLIKEVTEDKYSKEKIEIIYRTQIFKLIATQFQTIRAYYKNDSNMVNEFIEELNAHDKFYDKYKHKIPVYKINQQ